LLHNPFRCATILRYVVCAQTIGAQRYVRRQRWKKIQFRKVIIYKSMSYIFKIFRAVQALNASTA